MARTRKAQQSIEDAAKAADAAIEARARELADNPPAPEDDPPVDEQIEEAPVEDLEGYDFSNLDEGNPPVNAQPDSEIQHKYDVLQGKYNAETKRLSEMLATALSDIEALKSQASHKAPPQDEPTADTDVDTLKEEYPALYKSILALARKEVQSEVGKAIKGTETKVDNIIQRTEADNRNAYYLRLGELVPGYEQINSHPAFLKWLAEPVNELSSTTRREFLNAAFTRMDAQGTAKFFNAFIKEKGIRPKGNQPKEPDQIAPDTSGNVSRVNNATSSKEWTRAKIAKFYQDKQAGLLPGTEAEIAKQEAQIFQAVREGKVKGS